MAGVFQTQVYPPIFSARPVIVRRAALVPSRGDGGVGSASLSRCGM